MKLTQRAMVIVAAVMMMIFTQIESAVAAIDTTNLTADITAALDVFWLIPDSIVNHFGTLITLILFGAIIGLIGIILVFMRKILGRSTQSAGGIGKE